VANFRKNFYFKIGQKSKPSIHPFGGKHSFHQKQTSLPHKNPPTKIAHRGEYMPFSAKAHTNSVPAHYFRCQLPSIPSANVFFPKKTSDRVGSFFACYGPQKISPSTQKGT
jgi:hypothetical protein